METVLVKTKADWDRWVKKAREWYADFEPLDADFRGPCLVVWSEAEMNGYPRITWMDYSLSELQGYVSALSETPA